MRSMTKAPAPIADLIVRTHHTAFSCRDWQKARDFFVDFCGFKVLGENLDRGEPELANVVAMPGARCKWAMLGRDGFHIELFEWTTPKGEPIPIRQCDLGYTHIAFQVTNAAEVHRRLIAAGYEPLSAPISLRGGRANAFYCKGPEGAMIEFVEYPFGA
jgi:glyoxylase I family protein